MIIFDLDGTLADCEHRRHFIDPIKSGLVWAGREGAYCGNWTKNGIAVKWKPDWRSFYESCSEDLVIKPTASIFIFLLFHRCAIEIWSGRCESVRAKTEAWIIDKVLFGNDLMLPKLKMRPKGDSTPDDVLKQTWLNERCSDLLEAKIEGRNPIKHDIEYVFDDRPKVVRLWRNRGIFVFNCCQNDEEF